MDNTVSTAEIKGLKSIRQGPRLIGIAGAQNCFTGSMGAVAFLDCWYCNNSIVAKFESNADLDACSDDQAAELFKSYGWSINPTICPDCKPVREV